MADVTTRASSCQPTMAGQREAVSCEAKRGTNPSATRPHNSHAIARTWAAAMHRRKRPVIKISDAPNPFSPRPTEQVASAGGLECHAARLIGCPTPAGPLNRNVPRPTSLLAWYRRQALPRPRLQSYHSTRNKLIELRNRQLTRCARPPVHSHAGTGKKENRSRLSTGLILCGGGRWHKCEVQKFRVD